MSGTAELSPLFSASRRRTATNSSTGTTASNTTTSTTSFQRESTRLRSNVADQVQRDLLPAGRLLSVFLVLCELIAEALVLGASWGQPCDRPLRFWVGVLAALQTATVALHLVNICTDRNRDAFTPHRNGLSASDPDMYDDAPSNIHQHTTQQRTIFARLPFSLGVITPTTNSGPVRIELNVDGASNTASNGRSTTSSNSAVSIGSNENDGDVILSTSTSPPSATATTQPTASATVAFLPGSRDEENSGRPEFVDQYVRIVNALYLVWYIIGSVWVSGGGNCHASAPHLYRLVVALTIIYYALLFLPLACFCLIVCCLPLFILVYRIMLPYAERERRRARAADPDLVQSLNCVPYSSNSFRSLSGADEDASCVICLCDYEPGEQILFLPCKHHFHRSCIQTWLSLDKSCCLCKQDIDARTNSDNEPV